jgi:hypothetical protein
MQALPSKEAAQLKAIARKQPPLRVEDDLGDTVSMDKMLGNPRQRLSRLLRTAARYVHFFRIKIICRCLLLTTPINCVFVSDNEPFPD